MFIWKHIDIDPNEVEWIKERYRTLLPGPNHFFNTVELGITSFMGRRVFKTVLIHAQPLSVGMIHRDHRPHDGNVLAINIALENCERSITEFWETTDTNTSIDITSSGSPYIGIDRKLCKKIDEYTLDKPVLFKTNIPHSVTNYSNKSRYAISIRFVDDPWDLVGVH